MTIVVVAAVVVVARLRLRLSRLRLLLLRLLRLRRLWLSMGALVAAGEPPRSSRRDLVSACWREGGAA